MQNLVGHQVVQDERRGSCRVDGVRYPENELLVVRPIGMLPYGQFSVSGLVGWAVTAYTDPSVAPNSKPWAHLGDIEALQQELIKRRV